jgi:Flp pilus assembly protein TadD
MPEQALQSMQQAVELHSNDIRTRLTVAEWAVERGLIEFGRTNVEAALELDDDSVGVHVLQARIARLSSDLEAAESILTAAILKYPNSVAVANELARTLALSDDAGKRESGLEYARRNHQIVRDRTTGAGREAILTYAWLLLKNGQTEHAENVLHTLPDGSPVSSENAYYAGAIYAARNRLQLATQTLRAALASEVAFPERDAAETLLEELQTASAPR